MRLSVDQRQHLAQSGMTIPFPATTEYIGVRRVRCIWFNRSSGHYVADCGSCYMWTDDGERWRVVPGSAPCERGPMELATVIASRFL